MHLKYLLCHKTYVSLQENLIVRCTRNSPATTTTALTRRPFIRILSSSSQSSRSGSLRFSRSSNTSLKSSSNSNRSGDHNITPREKRFDRKTDCPVIAVIEPSFNENESFDKKHKRAIMECTISVPTTINEESSRHNSLVPPTKLSPSPSINAISEANESIENAGNQLDIPVTVFHSNRSTTSPCLNFTEEHDSSENYITDIPLNVLSSNNALLPPTAVV